MSKELTESDFIIAAYDKYNRDGEIEVLQDEGIPDGKVSQSDEGAYVLAWVWVSNEDAEEVRS